MTVTPVAGLETTEAGGEATFTVELDSEPTGDVTIALTSSDETEGRIDKDSLTFTPDNWNQAQTVTVTGQDDQLDDGDVAYAIRTAAAVSTDAAYSGLDPADVLVTNIDDDVLGITVSEQAVSVDEAGGQATYTVVLRSRPTGDVTVTPTSSAPANATVSGALTFTPENWDVPQTVTVTGVDDDIDNDPDRSATISHGVAGGDYDGAQAADVSVTVRDDDASGILVSEQAVTVDEAGGEATYTVVLRSRPTGDVTVTPTSSDTTAATVSGALTFTPENWDVPQTVTVTGVNDDIDNDPDRSATISHGVAGGDYDGAPAADVAVTVRDDDASGILVSEQAVSVDEAGGTATYTVVLRSRPTGDVTVTPTSSAPANATVSGALTFTPENWGRAADGDGDRRQRRHRQRPGPPGRCQPWRGGRRL